MGIAHKMQDQSPHTDAPERLSVAEKISFALALLLGLGGGITVVDPDKSVGYALVVFCLLGLLGLGYHHLDEMLPRKWRMGRRVFYAGNLGLFIVVFVTWKVLSAKPAIEKHNASLATLGVSPLLADCATAPQDNETDGLEASEKLATSGSDTAFCGFIQKSDQDLVLYRTSFVSGVSDFSRTTLYGSEFVYRFTYHFKSHRFGFSFYMPARESDEEYEGITNFVGKTFKDLVRNARTVRHGNFSISDEGVPTMVMDIYSERQLSYPLPDYFRGIILRETGWSVTFHAPNGVIY